MPTDSPDGARIRNPVWGSGERGLKAAGQSRSPPPYGALGRGTLDAGAPEAEMLAGGCAYGWCWGGYGWGGYGWGGYGWGG
eukprot:CAMPEP_0181205128 /NCGR_PEP_ID=MMETSP1096-20121128/20302_1 /TAXON_ID=156174 ORGANISM="Chrysochromulina ericina, Strain CCMP281" /NCGR_SAMPLE_ID=MMETSP1096 /ASSEMBLY_ACC=CAM_ASM_000453 /LENGTH=80 /DNA_ID=CAMNT_0023295871 /DNA_START=543 /DNA_END=782 /DNA_ORIENTATION=+